MARDPRKFKGRSRLLSALAGGSGGGSNSVLTPDDINPNYGVAQGDIDPNDTTPAEQQLPGKGRSTIGRLFLGPNAADKLNTQYLTQQALSKLDLGNLAEQLKLTSASDLDLYKKKEEAGLGFNKQKGEIELGFNARRLAQGNQAQMDASDAVRQRLAGQVASTLARDAQAAYTGNPNSLAPIAAAAPNVVNPVAQDLLTKYGASKVSDLGLYGAAGLAEPAYNLALGAQAVRPMIPQLSTTGAEADIAKNLFNTDAFNADRSVLPSKTANALQTLKLQGDVLNDPRMPEAMKNSRLAELAIPVTDNQVKQRINVGSTVFDPISGKMYTAEHFTPESQLVNKTMPNPKGGPPIPIGTATIHTTLRHPGTVKPIPMTPEEESAAADAELAKRSKPPVPSAAPTEEEPAATENTPVAPATTEPSKEAPVPAAPPELGRYQDQYRKLVGSTNANDSRPALTAKDSFYQSLLRLGNRTPEYIGSSSVKEDNSTAAERLLKNDPEFHKIIQSVPPDVQAGVYKLALTLANRLQK